MLNIPTGECIQYITQCKKEKGVRPARANNVVQCDASLTLTSAIDSSQGRPSCAPIRVGQITLLYDAVQTESTDCNWNGSNHRVGVWKKYSLIRIGH